MAIRDSASRSAQVSRSGRNRRPQVSWLVFLGFLPSPSLAAEPVEDFHVSAGRPDANGWMLHTVQSSFQAGTTKIHVLTPDGPVPNRPYATLFVLPVEASDGRRWGDAMQEVRRLDLHNRHRLVCVYPTFSHLPWYADHPQQVATRQESYFLRVVVPFVERTYPVRRDSTGRLLLGFSKSGWGAFSLLLRHPDVFGKAAAWDAPLAMSQPNRYGMEEIFATQENFERYRITSLLKERAVVLQTGKRLVHLGYGNFRDQHLAVELLLNELQISHVFRDGPQRPHAWDSGWLPEAVQLLVE
ncbi:MAG: esterase family protein [Pirellulaceae bacterium]|nr:esterase family protein [Pirellulaceae bacterium]